MAMYRVRNNLVLGKRVINRNSIVSLDLSAAKIDKLIEVGAITRVAAPPLAVLPGWEDRANRLEKFGVITVEELIEADASELARKLRIKLLTIQRWQSDVVEWLQAPPKDG